MHEVIVTKVTLEHSLQLRDVLHLCHDKEKQMFVMPSTLQVIGISQEFNKIVNNGIYDSAGAVNSILEIRKLA